MARIARAIRSICSVRPISPKMSRGWRGWRCTPCPRISIRDHYKMLSCGANKRRVENAHMYKVVLLRHGESVWNMENRFTGWTDVDLTQRGVEEAKRAGEVLKEAGFVFDCAYTSVLKRAIKTLWLALERMDLMWIPVRHSWRLKG